MTPHRVHNFNPGPAALPLVVLQQIQQEMLDFRGTGMSILEHSHRASTYEAVHQETNHLLRKLLKVPADYHTLWMQGGGNGQFAIVPLNLLCPGQHADYVVTGVWSEKALAEAKLIGDARAVASTQNSDGSYTRVPKPAEVQVDPKASYLHITSNNTIYGSQFHDFPRSNFSGAGGVPLVADMSSDLLWRPIDVTQFGLIYAAAQKNIGPAGITTVIVHRDLVARGSNSIPKIFRYATLAKEDSLQNTIPTFAVYVCNLVLRWIDGLGGLEAIERRNRQKASSLYGCIDELVDFYRCPVEVDSRSVMNVVFRLPSEDLEKRFLSEATSHGFIGLKGHRSVGGIRVSMYNAVEPSSVDALVSFMRHFAATCG